MKKTLLAIAATTLCIANVNAQETKVAIGMSG